MKANADRCHLLVTRVTNVTGNNAEFHVKNSRKEKLLGVKIDTNRYQNFCSKIMFFLLCKEACQKLYTLARVVNFKDLAKRQSLMKEFITYQFKYCSLI